MSPLIEIALAERECKWLMLDMRDEPEVQACIVVPLFGRNHHAGMDCWCHPLRDGGVITHEVMQ